jgi:hypothetical protein
MAIMSGLLAGVFAASSRCSAIVKSVREYSAASQGVSDRMEQIRNINWSVVTSGSRLAADVMGTTPGSAALISGTEVLTVSAYPAVSPSPTPIKIQRSGASVNVVTENTTFIDSNTLLVTSRWSWRATFGGRLCVREASTIVTRR